MPSTENADTPRQGEPQDASLVNLLGQLFRDAETLLLQEFALFRAELGENAGRLTGGALLIAAGVATALIGGLALVAAVIVLLGYVIPFWLASALVGTIFCGAGGTLILYGRRQIARANFVPRQTWQSLRETGEWLGEELR